MSPQHLNAILSQVSHRCARSRHHYTSSTSHLRAHDSNDYSKTVFVPRSKFPIRHDPKVELAVQEDSKFAHTYLEQDPARKPYVVHDGPPFANGQIHLGHAINKILKDIAARYAMITGHKVEFITGWDCHGLPIEMQIIKLLEEQQRQSNYGGSLLLEYTASPEHFRAKARTYAKSQIDLQMASFKRIGLLTDWNKRYTTDDPAYVANQLRAFSQLYEQKLIFKDLMPVNWSMTNKTTIADADIEYRDSHISKSAYVLYQIVNPPFTADIPGQPFYALVWTTTPWTLLENQAIAFNKQETYCILKAWNSVPQDTKNLLISIDCLNGIQGLLSRLGYQCEVLSYVPGKSLVGLTYAPRLDSLIEDSERACCEKSKPLPFLHAEFVEGAKGTGLVHMAPNYGVDDFQLIRQNKIPVESGLVDKTGHYSDKAGKLLAGKHILKDGTQEILSQLDQRKALLFTELFQHSYPYEIRTNQPIITRASLQIFLDTSKIIPRCLKALESSSFFPESRRRHLINTLTSSPNWCISRQRVWGTPIPVLYEAQDVDQEKMISHPQIVEHFCKLLYKKRFMDYWWTSDQADFLPQEILDSCKLPYKSENLVRGMDIFDVWSDSGLSWHTVTNSLNDPKSQADLYLEGVDQIRGWFSASSLLSVALRGCLPSKRFFLHGFAVDGNGRKMSKSQGNVVDPIKLFETYGVDPIRLWAAKSAGDNANICVRSSEFKSSINEMINKIRVTLRFLIGALADNDTFDVKIDHTKLELFDQYYLDNLYRFGSTVDDHYKNYRYDLVIAAVNRFIVKDFSPIYITSTKDILYCEDQDSERRKSCLNVMNLTYNILLRAIYPLVPHIVHEASGYMKPSEPLLEWQDLGYKAAWKNDVLRSQYDAIIRIRGAIQSQMGSRFDMLRDHDALLLINDKKIFKHVVKIAESDVIAEMFKTSTLILGHDGELNRDGIQEHSGELRVGGQILVEIGEKETPIRFEIRYKKSYNKKCLRCRRYTVLAVNEDANVCDRCKNTLHKLD